MTGPRQVGKTTLVHQVLGQIDSPSRFASADEPALRDTTWLHAQWDAARLMARDTRRAPSSPSMRFRRSAAGRRRSKGCGTRTRQAGLVFTWSSWARRRSSSRSAWSRASPDASSNCASLTGRSTRCDSAFGFSLDQFIFFGGYPGAAPLVNDADRWRRYMLDSLIETTISRDVLLMRRVDKPALLRRLFDLGCRYSGQILSYNKMLGQLQDAGNTTTLAHYLDLLAGVGMSPEFRSTPGEADRQRGSSPKLQVLNTALMTAQAGLTPDEATVEPEFWGRL